MASAPRLCDDLVMRNHPGHSAIALLGILAAGASCAPRPRPAPTSPSLAPPQHLQRWYALEFESARIGWAEEDEYRDGDRLRWSRREYLQFRRGEQQVALDTRLNLEGGIGADAVSAADLVTIEVRACVVDIGDAKSRTGDPPKAGSAPRCNGDSAALSYRGHARRDATSWTIIDDRGTRQLPHQAQPAEWFDLLPQRSDFTATPIFFAARRFAIGRGSRRWIDARTWIGAVVVDGATLEVSTELGDDDRPRVTIDATGLVATRVSQSPSQVAFPLADLVALSSVSISGRRSRTAADGSAHRHTIKLDFPSPAPPPPLAPGQHITADLSAWTIELGSLSTDVVAADEQATVSAIREVAAAIADDAPGLAAGAGRGDCTAHALRYAAAARQRGWPTQLATGFVLVDSTLIRHRWAVTWTGRRWIAIDPSADPSAPEPRLFTLAIHRATIEALVAAEVAFTPLRGARASWQP